MSKKAIKITLSITLIAISYGFIIYKIIQFDELRKIDISTFYSLKNNFICLIFAFLLMPINWGIEALKWQWLIRNIQFINYSYSFKAVFSGIALGIFTPNRIGEIGGRITFLDKGKRTFGLLATSLGSFAQFITTIMLGLAGLALFLFRYPYKTSLNPLFDRTFAITILIILIFLIWFYFNTKLIKPLLLKIPFFSKRISQLDYFSETKPLLLFKVLFLSISRYVIFITQFYLLLTFFDIQINTLQAFISISLIYIVSTLIPTTTLIELGIKGSLSIFFIGMFSENYFGIVLSTIFLWIINLAIPSIIGPFFFIKKNLR